MAGPSVESKAVCFSPSRVHVAEQRLSLPPIRPGQIVWRLTGLRLRGAMLSVSGRPFAITYMYGHVPLAGSPYQVPTPSLDRPKYVLVSENVYLANGPPMRAPFHGSGYWEYARDLVCRHLLVSASTNISAGLTLAVVNRLQARAGCGK